MHVFVRFRAPFEGHGAATAAGAAGAAAQRCRLPAARQRGARAALASAAQRAPGPLKTLFGHVFHLFSSKIIMVFTFSLHFSIILNHFLHVSWWFTVPNHFESITWQVREAAGAVREPHGLGASGGEPPGVGAAHPAGRPGAGAQGA